MYFDNTKRELVYHTTNHRDIKIIEIANFCFSTNSRMVLIIPIIKKYTFEIEECFNILGDDLLIYEMNSDIDIVLADKSMKYVEYIKSAELYE